MLTSCVMRARTGGPVRCGATGLAEMPCLDVHVGTIEEHQLRANHRHHSKTEVFLTWGARTHWRVQEAARDGGRGRARSH